MEYTNLGRTGLSVSRLCLGTMNFGPQTSEPDSFAIMDRALEVGINFFDPTHVYGWKPGEGATEQIIGRWLDQGGGRRYGYGFEPRTVNGRTVFGHGGGGPRGVAICNDIDIFADGSWTVVVMSNYDAPVCQTLKQSITDMLAVN